MTEGGGKVECIITVTEDFIKVTSVTINKDNTSIPIGGSEQLTATVKPDEATNKTVTWESSKPEVATVSATGLIEAKTAGDVVITATSQDGGKSDICNVTVIDPTIYVTGVTIEPATLSLNLGKTSTLTATIAPVDATNKQIEWSSNKPEIVSVSNEGQVEAKTAGEAIITVTTKDGSKTATCTITVPAPKEYAVGNAYPDAENPIGVVFWVSPDDKTKGKAISLEETMLAWCLETAWAVTGAQDLDDGAGNMAKIKAIADWQNNYPAFKWCADLGEDWYIPSVNEWKMVYNNKSMTSATLRQLGKTPLQDAIYWSSSECSEEDMSESSVNSFSMRKNSVYQDQKQYAENYVRAILSF